MKAWRVYGIGDMRLDDIPVPEVKPGSVLIKVKVLQPSVTEVAMLRGMDVAGSGNLGKMIEEKGPLQWLGHEFCGEIAEVGEGVRNVKVGDRVFFPRILPCHNCAACRAGHEEYCHTFLPLGMGIPGCLAEYMTLPAEQVASVPESITDSEVATMQPVVSCVANVCVTKIEPGDTVVALGQGTMGLNTMQISRACGAGKTIAIDIRDDVLAVSSKLGADITINASKVEPVAAVMEMTSGVGADVVFECAGGSPGLGLAGLKTLHQALNMVRNHGKIMQVSFLPPDAALPITMVDRKGIHYLGRTHPFVKQLNYTIELVASKRIQLVPTITHVLEGLDKVPEAFEITGNKAKYGALNPAQVVVAR